jgi:hypothetical protein
MKSQNDFIFAETRKNPKTEEKNMRKQMVALLAGAMLMMATSAMALTLTLSDGTATQSVTNAGNTASFIDSFTTFSQFDVAVVGKKKNTTGQVFEDTAAVDITYNGTGPATFTISLSDVGFLLNTPLTSPNALATMAIHTISSDAAVAFSGYYDNANVLGATTNLVGLLNLAPNVTPGADASLVNLITTSNPFSLTEVVTLSFTGAGQTVSLDANLNVAPVPEPGTMMLLGMGMLGMAVYGKRRMNKQA